MRRAVSETPSTSKRTWFSRIAELERVALGRLRDPGDLAERPRRHDRLELPAGPGSSAVS